jgi:hypothetical protein
MQKFKARLEGVILGALVLASTMAIAATVTDLRSTMVKGTLARANGGTGTTISATAAAAAASAVNTAGGLAALDSNAKLPEAQLPSTVLSVTGTPAADNLFAMGAGSSVVPVWSTERCWGNWRNNLRNSCNWFNGKVHLCIFCRRGHFGS